MPAPFAEVAHLAVRTLREVYGVARPSDLVYRRFARGGHDFADPSLGIAAERPTTPRGAGEPAAPTLEALTTVVETTLRRLSGAETLAPEPAGSYRVTIDAVELDAQILPGDPPALHVYTSVLSGPATPELLAALNELNAGLVFARVLHANGQVFVSLELPAPEITEAGVTWACGVIDGSARRVHASLTGRFHPGSEQGAGPKLLN
jgi:hypothetical protein